RKIIEVVVSELQARYQDRYERIFDENRAFMRFLRAHDAPTPAMLSVAAELTLGRRILERLSELAFGQPTFAVGETGRRGLAAESARLGMSLELPVLPALLGSRVLEAVEGLSAGRLGARAAAAAIAAYLDLARDLRVRVDQWRAQ